MRAGERPDAAGIGGVIFDLDGTLYALDRAFELRLIARMWRSLGFLRQLPRARASIRPQTFEGPEPLLGALFGELARRAGASPEQARRWYSKIFLPAFVATLKAGCSARPGLEALLVEMRGRGLALAVLSDYGHVDARLDAIGLPRGLFDLRVSSDEFGALKPSARPLLGVAARVGIEPERLLVVGDRDAMDGAGARAAGMRYLEVRGRSGGESTSDWAEARAWLEALEFEAN